MCKESPGPRCSNHARIAMEKTLEDLNQARASFPAGSLEVKAAERAHKEAVESFRATPDGLAQIAMESPELLPKYQKTRDFQVEALNEIRSGRFDHVATLLTSTQAFFDRDEISSVLGSVRKVSEHNHINLQVAEKKPNELTNEEKKHHYLSILNHYEGRLRDAQRGCLTPQQMDILMDLRKQKPPKEITSLEAYGQAFSALSQSRNLMRKEIHRIAVLQDVSPKVAGAFHDAYRNEYNTKYASLPAKQQPNPPKEWVEGQYATTGFQNDTSTKLAPSDPATMYATYRLRSDMNAIPDYLKNSRNVATLSVEDGEKVNIVLCNSKGKEIENTHITAGDIHSAIQKLQGRIIVLGNDNETKNWLVSLSKKSSLKSSVLPTYEFSSKHFNLPDNSVMTLCQAMNVENQGTKAEVTMNAYLAAKNKVASKWNSKAPRRQASPLDELPLASRWS